MMGGCRFDPETLEAYVFGELDDDQSTEVILHLGACEACAQEARVMRAERAIFRERAVAATPGLPSFAGVMDRVREQAPIDLAARRAWWRRGAILAVATAAAASFLLALPAAHEPPAAQAALVQAESPQASCYEGEPPATEQAVFEAEYEMASVENAFSACLLTSPHAPKPTVTCCAENEPREGADDNGSCTSYRP